MKQTLLAILFLFISSLTVVTALNSPAASGTTIVTGDPVEVRLFPNPTTHYFEITTTENVRKVEIFNLLGSKIVDFDFMESNHYDISDLPNGMYLIQLVDDKRRVITTRRLQKR